MPTNKNNEMFTAPAGHVLAHNRYTTSGRGVHVMPTEGDRQPAGTRRTALCGQWWQQQHDRKRNPDWAEQHRAWVDAGRPVGEQPEWSFPCEPHYQGEIPAAPVSMVCRRCERKAAALDEAGA